MITFEAEVIEIRTKKTGLDRCVRIVLETDNDSATELRKFIAEKTIQIRVEENRG